jgi:hypothetical protein
MEMTKVNKRKMYSKYSLWIFVNHAICQNSLQFDNNNYNHVVEENFQRRLFNLNAWCGIFGDRLN